MNTVVVISWWAKTVIIFFTDIDDFYMLDLGKYRTIRWAKSYIRKEIFNRYGVALSHMKLVKDTPSVSFLLAKRATKEI